MPRHKDENSDDDSGKKNNQGRHRAEPPKCPECNGDKIVRRNIDNMNELLKCPICKGAGTV